MIKKDHVKYQTSSHQVILWINTILYCYLLVGSQQTCNIKLTPSLRLQVHCKGRWNEIKCWSLFFSLNINNIPIYFSKPIVTTIDIMVIMELQIPCALDRLRLRPDTKSTRDFCREENCYIKQKQNLYRSHHRRDHTDAEV